MKNKQITIGSIALDLNKIHKIPMEASIISPSGKELITEYLMTQTLIRKGNKSSQRGSYLDMNLTGEYIDWNWKTSRGTFPKRLAKYFYEEYDVVLSQEQLTHIGQLARGNSTDTSSFYMDITQDLDWRAGDFGDHGSCFWTSHVGARHMLKNHGAYAIRFYDKNPNFGSAGIDNKEYFGKARCWFVKEDVGGKEICILFNGYGLTVLQIVHIISEYTGMHYRKIGLTNNGNDNGELWIGARNSENRGSGYIIGNMLDIKSISEYDFHWDNEEGDEEDIYHCDSCGDRIDEDNAYNDDNGTYCHNCYYDNHSMCVSCNDDYYSDEMTSVGDDMVCERCLSRYYFSCNNCGEYYSEDDIHHFEGLNLDLCNDCAEDTIQCQDCKEYHWVSRRKVHNITIEREDLTVCNDCEQIRRDEIESRLMDENGLEEAPARKPESTR